MDLIASHESALRELAPIELCKQEAGEIVVPAGQPCPCPNCSIRRIDAGYLDALEADVQALHTKTFASSRTGDLEAWEKLYALPADPSLTIDQRWDRVDAARTAKRGLSKSFFLDLAVRLGYQIAIQRGVYPFLSGVSKSGDNVVSVNRFSSPTPGDTTDIRNKPSYPANPYDSTSGQIDSAQSPYPSDYWTFVVTILDLGSNPSSSLLKQRFESLKPYYSLIIWQES